MGLSQTHYSPTPQGRFRSETGYSHEIVDRVSTLVDSSPLRTVFVMNDELLRHGFMHVVSQATGIQFVGIYAMAPD